MIVLLEAIYAFQSVGISTLGHHTFFKKTKYKNAATL
jgi:hypothetical protein